MYVQSFSCYIFLYVVQYKILWVVSGFQGFVAT